MKTIQSWMGKEERVDTMVMKAVGYDKSTLYDSSK